MTWEELRDNLMTLVDLGVVKVEEQPDQIGVLLGNDAASPSIALRRLGSNGCGLVAIGRNCDCENGLVAREYPDNIAQAWVDILPMVVINLMLTSGDSPDVAFAMIRAAATVLGRAGQNSSARVEEVGHRDVPWPE